MAAPQPIENQQYACEVFEQKHDMECTTLTRILTRYFAYYHGWRTHLSLAMDCPEPRPVHGPDRGKVIAVPEAGELHHHYERRAA